MTPLMLGPCVWHCILSEEYYAKLLSLITDKDIDCWDSKEIIQHIDEYMKIVYAIGCLALEGIPNAVEANKNSFSPEIRTEMKEHRYIQPVHKILQMLHYVPLYLPSC